MKRIQKGLLVLTIFLLLAPGMTVGAAKSVKINSTNFPNAAFRKYLKANYDTDGNGRIDDVSKVKEIRIHEVASLKGIEHFTNLRRLYCNGTGKSGSSLKNIDLTKCTKLEVVDVTENRLTKLNVSKCPNLKQLYCDSNLLTSLNVSKCPKLDWLRCGNNKLTSLDVSKCTLLEMLACDLNNIKTLSISKNTKLEKLTCRDNALTKLTLNSILKELDCSENKLTSVDFSKCKKIEYVKCSYNKLTSLNLKNSPEIRILIADHNKFTKVYLSKNMNWKTFMSAFDDGVKVYTYKTYKIIYHLNGGKNNTKNPSTFKNGGGGVELKNPTRSGYKFVGWYKNENLTGRVKRISSSRNGDIHLYAKWTKK